MEANLAYQDDNILLNTIRIPNSGKLKQLASKLPKSNYGDLSTQSSGKSQVDKEISSTNSYSKRGNNHDRDSKKSDESGVFKNRYIIKGSKLNRSETRKRAHTNDKKPIDRQFSYRHYGNDNNDYSVLNPNLSLNLSREKKHKRADSSLMKLKKLKADKASLERFLEENNTSKRKMPRINGKYTRKYFQSSN